MPLKIRIVYFILWEFETSRNTNQNEFYCVFKCAYIDMFKLFDRNIIETNQM